MKPTRPSQPSLAVALNCGIGSRSLNALVKALDSSYGYFVSNGMVPDFSLVYLGFSFDHRSLEVW